MFKLVQPDKQCGKATLSTIVCVPSVDNHTTKSTKFNKHASNWPFAYTVIVFVLENGCAYGATRGCPATGIHHIRTFLGFIDDFIAEVLNRCHVIMIVSHANGSMSIRYDATHQQEGQPKPHCVFT